MSDERGMRKDVRELRKCENDLTAHGRGAGAGGTSSKLDWRKEGEG
jgi:hypothetical protein